MAFSLSQFPSPPTTKPLPYPKLPPPFKSTLIPNSPSPNRHHHHRRSTVLVHAGEDPQKPTVSEPPNPPSDEELSDLGAEIKKAMMETEKKKDDNVLSGVVEEIGKIEWPAFNKVVGTTGVVLGVIAGSSVVLLTVNAVLAELSDRVFAGRGVQDFFG